MIKVTVLSYNPKAIKKADTDYVFSGAVEDDGPAFIMKASTEGLNPAQIESMDTLIQIRALTGYLNKTAAKLEPLTVVVTKPEVLDVINTEGMDSVIQHPEDIAEFLAARFDVKTAINAFTNLTITLDKASVRANARLMVIGDKSIDLIK